jgi:hypothetical protein
MKASEALQLWNQSTPLAVSKVEWDGTTLTIDGPGWGVSTLETWRVTGSQGLVAGCFDDHVEKGLAILRKARFIAVESFTPLDLDLRLRTDDGYFLEIFVASSLEPWTASFPGCALCAADPFDKTVVFVDQWPENKVRHDGK